MEIKLQNNKSMTLGKFGIEIEAYGATRQAVADALNAAGLRCAVEGYNHVTRRHWKVVTDVSIRGRQSFELVSPVLEGADGLEQVRKACEALNSVNAKINKSCGLHVHHDATELGSRGIRKVVKVYRRIEHIIDDCMPRSRRGNSNRYCRSVHAGIDYNPRDRYRKVNLTSFYRHNTVEFRHHSGTIECDKIQNWVLLTALIVEKAKGRVTSEKKVDRWLDVIWLLNAAQTRHGNVSSIVRRMDQFYRGRMAALAAAA